MITVNKMGLIILLLAALLSTSCSEGSVDPTPRPKLTDSTGATEAPISGVVTGKNGRRYLEVDGKPFLMLGAQLRTDFFRQLEKKSLADLDSYFELASRLNITVLQVPLTWRDVEPDKDDYRHEVIDAYIGYCEKYGLKLELLWFGSYMCGYSVAGYLPDYVLQDKKTYPELNASAAFEGWLGTHYYLVPNSPKLMEREKSALAYAMNAINKYDKQHGGKKTVVGMQIENEPDMLATRHNQAHGYPPDDLWTPLINMLDQLGQVVKASPYPCYTRVNMTTTYPDYIQKSRHIASTTGIDLVGIDPYIDDLAAIGDQLQQLGGFPGNFAHIAENGGEYANTDLLTLKALTMGGGYSVFEVVTTSHPYLTDWTLRGVFNPDFTYKPHTQRIIDANSIYKKAWLDLAGAPIDDICGFNLQDNSGLPIAEEIKSTTHATISWKTKSRGVAFAVEGETHLTFASTQADIMQFSGSELQSVSIGAYNQKGDWIEDRRYTGDLQQIELEPGVVYRATLIRN